MKIIIAIGFNWYTGTDNPTLTWEENTTSLKIRWWRKKAEIFQLVLDSLTRISRSAQALKHGTVTTIWPQLSFILGICMHVDPCVQPCLECLNLHACVWLRACVMSSEQMNKWYIQFSELRWTTIRHKLISFRFRYRDFPLIYIWGDVKVEVWNQLAP